MIENWVKEVGGVAYLAIKEMVDNLDKDTFIDNQVLTLDAEKCKEILTENDISFDSDDLETLQELVSENVKDGTIEPDNFDFDEDAAREAIQDDALEICVRSDWYDLGSKDNKPSEFYILITTGGPAVRIIGKLNEYGEPESPRLQVQDWGKPWTEYFTDEVILLTYCNQFYFGE